MPAIIADAAADPIWAAAVIATIAHATPGRIRPFSTARADPSESAPTISASGTAPAPMKAPPMPQATSVPAAMRA